jgi:hypothetical protein
MRVSGGTHLNRVSWRASGDIMLFTTPPDASLRPQRKKNHALCGARSLSLSLSLSQRMRAVREVIDGKANAHVRQTLRFFVGDAPPFLELLVLVVVGDGGGKNSSCPETTI